MNIVVGSDKNGYALKEEVAAMLREQGHVVYDVGTTDLNDPKPHTIAAPAAAKMIQSGQAERGFLFCGTGMGMSIAANKHKGIYAAVVESLYSAEYCRKINNANIMCTGSFIVGTAMAKEMVNIFLNTEFMQDFPQWRIEFFGGQQKILQQLEEELFKE